MSTSTQDAPASSMCVTSVTQHLLEETPSCLFPILRKSTDRLACHLQTFRTHLDTLENDLIAIERNREKTARFACQGAFLCQALDDAEAETKNHPAQSELPALLALFSCAKRFSKALTDSLNTSGSTASETAAPITEAPPVDSTHQT